MSGFMRTLGLLFLLTGLGCSQTLQSDLEEKEANELLWALSRAGLSGEKKDSGAGRWRVEVESGSMPAALRCLSEAGLPRRRHPGFKGVYEERGLVPDRLEARALYLSALQDELAATLEEVEGVERARVHASPPMRDPRRRQSAESGRASVLISHRSAKPPLSPDQVQRIISHAVQGIGTEQVAVVFVRSPERQQPGGAPQAMASPAPYRLGMIRPVVLALSLALALAAGLFALRRRMALGARRRVS